MLKSVIAALAALLLVAACGGASATTTPSVPRTTLDLAGSWQLVQGTLAGQPLPLVEDARVTLIVDESGASGQAACNQYFGELAIEDGRVSTTQLGQTEMACAEPVMALEAAYLSALAKVESAHVDGSQLVLTGSPGVELRFDRLQPPPAADIIGTMWQLESLVEGDSVSSIAGPPATLMLLADGSLRGSTGCRILTGRYEIRGDEIFANELGADGDCPPGAARAQDAHVVGVLGDGFRAAVDGPQLILGKDDGRGLVYRAGAE
jgi:heat shock protein HslJ